MRLALIAALVLHGCAALAADPIVGRASVTDGDTVIIRSTRIRLHGIDAPERAQLCQDVAGKPYRCGQAALAEELDKRSAAPTKPRAAALAAVEAVIAHLRTAAPNEDTRALGLGW